MKVYVVTIGDYSDYRIYGVYSTREKAKKKLADIRTLALNEGIWGDTEKLRELLK